MKKLFIFLFASFFISTGIGFAAISLPFSDLQNLPDFTWYKSAVYRLYHAGILKNDGGKNFRPNDAVNRAEMATMIDRSLSNQDNYFFYTYWKEYKDPIHEFSILYPTDWLEPVYSEYKMVDSIRKDISFNLPDSNFGYTISLIDTPLSLEEYLYQYSLQFSGNKNITIESLNLNGENAKKVKLESYDRSPSAGNLHPFSTDYEIFLQRDNTIFLIEGYNSTQNDFESFYRSFRFLNKKYSLDVTNWKKYENKELGFSFLCPPFLYIVAQLEKSSYLPEDILFSLRPFGSKWFGDSFLTIHWLTGNINDILHQNSQDYSLKESQILDFSTVAIYKTQWTVKSNGYEHNLYYLVPKNKDFILKIHAPEHLFASSIMEAMLRSFYFDT